ncbi:MAG: hydrolase, partial [Abyssibacter sp.]|uniref:hydrolase n=1 Tax=Abyssibacter sp. TaxID=2320200 RepID=UPI00321B6ADD
MQPIKKPHQQALDTLAERTETMRQQTADLASINSGSFNADGVNAVADALTGLFQPIADTVERVPIAPLRQLADNGEFVDRPMGDALVIRKRPHARRRVLLAGHLDTVFPSDSSFQSVRIEDDRLHGPGVADLKGGLVVMQHALSTLEQSPDAEHIGWTVVLNPDEEIGSMGSAALLDREARAHHVGMIYEPSLPSGNLVAARKGSGNFQIRVRGRAAHAGREHHLGRNAIRALADATVAIDNLNGQRNGVTINVGQVVGGGPVNIVPDLAILRLNVRLQRPEDQQWMLDHLTAIVDEINGRDGIEASLHGRFTRPPKVRTPALESLIGEISTCRDLLGMDFAWEDTGGCCDGNNLAAAGLANVDNLGVVGAHI